MNVFNAGKHICNTILDELHCVPKKKHVTTYWAIELELSVCNKFWHTYYREYRPSTDVFYFPTSPTSCTYFTLENCREL